MKETKRLLTEIKLTLYETKKIVSSLKEDENTALSDLKSKLNKLGFDDFGDKSVDDIELNKEK